jgi:hypothetical protein
VNNGSTTVRGLADALVGPMPEHLDFFLDMSVSGTVA